MIETSPELFINMKGIPDESSEEYLPFFKEERDKVRYGVTINGVFIHGWLYWHLNHWHIYRNILDARNNEVIRAFKKPQFRDNEWIIAEHIKKAEDEKKGLLIFGSRRIAKTMIEASWIGRGATIYEGSENVVSSTNTDDINLLTSAIDKGLAEVHPYFRFERLKYNWNKEVSLGIETKKGRKYEFSKILIRNLDEGRSTEAIAGTTPKTLVIDEIGKVEKILEAFAAAAPGFTSEYGWKCVPILTGTGGSFMSNSDAQKMFEEPEAYNFLAIEWPGREKKYGLFMPGKFRMEGKIQTKFGNYIKKKGILIPEDSELNTLEFFESDEEKAKLVTNEEIKRGELAKDPKSALKARMYFPEKPEDCFLSDITNPFPTEAIEQHLTFLDTLEVNGEPVELFRDKEGKVGFSYNTKLKEITDFPANNTTVKDAPIIMYEPPCNEKPPHLLYIAGGDPYNQNSSETSPSLGTIHIYKRLYDPINGSFQNMIVASYAGRPKEMKEWHKIVEMLLELYNATCMIENAGTNFIEYMANKHKSYYLADGYNLLKDISPNTTIKDRPKGLPPTPLVINHCMALLLDYCNEEIIGTDNQGNVVKKLGVARIRDKMLLTEMLHWQPKTNCDRIVAFRHALAYDSYLQRTNPLVKYSDEPEDKTPVKRPIHAPFRIRKPNLPPKRRGKIVI